MRRKIHVLMPVYRGNQYWHSSLQSLTTARHLFDQVIISFDGPSRSALTTYLEENWSDALQPVILETPTEMTWSEHVQWISEQPAVLALEPNDFLMIMSEDDLLQVDALEEGFGLLQDYGKAVLFGPWAASNNHNGADTPTHSIKLRPTVTRPPLIIRRLTQIAQDSHTTSVAGITLPVDIFRNYARLHGSRGESPVIGGVRAEYFLASQTGVAALVEASEPIVTVQRHKDQGSRSVSRSDWIQDECLYQMWLFTAPRGLPLRDRMAAVLRFLKRLPQAPRVVGKLLSATRTFNRVRNHSFP